MHYRKRTAIERVVSILMISVLATTGVLGVNNKAQGKKKMGDIKTEGAGLVSKVAPGETLPISVKLMNFGEGETVDVIINYKILNAQDELVKHEKETVAVETTASYTRKIPLPPDLPSGEYTAISEIQYKGQKVPAVSQFQFTVEKKIFGIFVSEFILYSVITLILVVGVIFLMRYIDKERKRRFSPHKYSDVKKGERIYYELIGDMIMQMRYREGDKAVELAKEVEGLEIDEDSCRVLNIDKDPAEIIALLMIEYEKNFGKKKADFISQKVNQKKPNTDKGLNKNIEMIKKYFS